MPILIKKVNQSTTTHILIENTSYLCIFVLLKSSSNHRRVRQRQRIQGKNQKERCLRKKMDLGLLFIAPEARCGWERSVLIR